jgi:hypothetical protein
MARAIAAVLLALLGLAAAPLARAAGTNPPTVVRNPGFAAPASDAAAGAPAIPRDGADARQLVPEGVRCPSGRRCVPAAAGDPPGSRLALPCGGAGFYCPLDDADDALPVPAGTFSTHAALL